MQEFTYLVSCRSRHSNHLFLHKDFSLPLRHTLHLLNALTIITDEKPRYYNKDHPIFPYVLKTNLHIITFLFPVISLNPFAPQSTTLAHSVFIFVFFFQERKPRE
jgi:hypothetical protein